MKLLEKLKIAFGFEAEPTTIAVEQPRAEGDGWRFDFDMPGIIGILFDGGAAYSIAEFKEALAGERPFPEGLPQETIDDISECLSQEGMPFSGGTYYTFSFDQRQKPFVPSSP